MAENDVALNETKAAENMKEPKPPKVQIAMTHQEIYESITYLLAERGWHLEAVNQKYDVFVPPAELGFSEVYRLYVYNKTEQPSYIADMQKAVDILAEIYHEVRSNLATKIFGELE